MKTSIIVFPGTKCEKDMAMDVEKISGRKANMIWHKETDIGNPDIIILPGGFSYGDYLRCGAMAAHSPIMQEVIKKAKNGTKILGVCNGFQMLVETKLLPGALLHNRTLKFICKQVNLRTETNNSPFTQNMNKGDIIKVPIAHGEGNYFADEKTIKTLEDNDRIAFKYCNEKGEIDEESNPNGSINNIAGIFSEDKKILGMMPHPENSILDYQANQNGKSLFEGILKEIA